MRAWVDPQHGVDGYGFYTPGNPVGTFVQVDDPDAPFKTIQHALNAVHQHLVTAFNAGHTSAEGIVYAMPGIYGPTTTGGPTANGEVFPIRMRDRVHLQGQGARGCIIRGDGETTSQIFLPLCPGIQVQEPVEEVLVTYSRSHKFNFDLGFLPPWQAQEETEEMLDGFTLQGGDVQVEFYREFHHTDSPELRGRISNCLFDMRHEWQIHPTSTPPEPPPPPITIDGPYIGIEMIKHFSQPGGYADQKVVIANNTFLMGEFHRLGGGEWEILARSRPEAVGIIDATDSGCGSSPNVDNDFLPRGLGNTIIVNNLFRTVPQEFGPTPFAMLGVDLLDTRVSTSGASNVDSNAFAPTRVGNSTNGFSNGFFCSRQVSPMVVGTGGLFGATLFDCRPVPMSCFDSPAGSCCQQGQLPVNPCAGMPPPIARVKIFDGTPSAVDVDPCFVGESLGSILASGPRYRDWRLLPESPLQDQGVTPEATLTLQNRFMVGHWTYVEPACTELQSFDWDHESFGNPRISGSQVDIGFDEFQMMIMSGSWANDSNSHNLSDFMNQTLEQGRPVRIMHFPFIPGQSLDITINGVFAVQTPPPGGAALPAWIQPPRTTAVIDPMLPVGFQTRYISFLNTSTSSTPPMPVNAHMPWNFAFASITSVGYLPLWNPLQPTSVFGRVFIADNETSTGYFGAQAVMHSSSPPIQYRSNLQYEYR